MKIEEPKTPYNYTNPNDEDAPDELDAKLLAEKLQLAARSASIDESIHSSDDDEDDEETPKQKAHRLEFEKRRKAHYKEFEAVKLARKLIEEEDDDQEDRQADPTKMDEDKPLEQEANQSRSN